MTFFRFRLFLMSRRGGFFFYLLEFRIGIYLIFFPCFNFSFRTLERIQDDTSMTNTRQNWSCRVYVFYYFMTLCRPTIRQPTKESSSSPAVSALESSGRKKINSSVNHFTPHRPSKGLSRAVSGDRECSE